MMTGFAPFALEALEWLLQGGADLSLTWISKPLAAGARACRRKILALRTASPRKDSTHG